MNQEKVNKIRAFNRFYTRVLGLLNKYYDGHFTLPEVRVMYEIYHHKKITSKEITELLSMDKSYLSRMLLSFDKNGLIKRKADKADSRVQEITLSAKGEKEFLAINRATESQIAALLSALTRHEIEDLIGHMDTIQKFFQKSVTNMHPLSEITIRTEIRPGDLGMITYLHGVLYQHEYQHGVSFESIVAGGLHEFYSTYNPANERLWIAEGNGEMIGCLLLKNRGETAQLRYFLIKPEYRGIGLGNKLLQLFIDFARACKYKNAYLWTTNELDTAHHLYEKIGFTLTAKKPSTEFGKQVMEQRYDVVF